MLGMFTTSGLHETGIIQKLQLWGRTAILSPSQTLTALCYYCCAVYDDYTDPNDLNSDVSSQDIFWVDFEILIDNLIITEPADIRTDVFVMPGEAQTLSVKASARKGTVYYEWYRGNEIVGHPLSHQPSLSVTEYHGLNQYYCVITDDYNNRAILRFCIHANNGLYAVPTPEIVFALPGQNAEFAVHTSVIRGPLTFKWYDSDGNLLPSTSDVATVLTPTEKGEYTYTCQVKDAYGNKRVVEFCLIVGDVQAITPGQVLDIIPDSAPYSYFAFTPVDTAYYTFTAEGQYVCRLERYESADPPILSVSDHTASAQAEGETLLYAICDGQQGVYRITVVDPTEGVFIFPAHLADLQGSAFAGIAGIRYAELNEALPVLPAGTFGDADLVQLVVHGKQTVIEDGAFSGKPLILCPEGSKAAEYAREKGLPWLYLAKEN